jgi:hypothetical protein
MKPLGIKKIDRLHTPLSVFLDDAVAGLVFCHCLGHFCIFPLKNILVLGGNGFVGSEILSTFAAHPEYHVMSLSRSKPKDPVKNAEYFFADLHDEEAIFPIFQKADVIINASGMVSYHKKHTHALRKSNVEALQVIGHVLQKTPNVHRFIHISSCASFGCQRGEFFGRFWVCVEKKRNTIFHTLIPNFLAMLLSDHFLFPQVFCFRLLFWVPRTQKCFRHFSNTQKKVLFFLRQKGRMASSMFGILPKQCFLLFSRIHQKNISSPKRPIRFWKFSK